MSKPICFIIQKFGDVFYDELYDDVIEIAVKEANSLCLRADKIPGGTLPLEKIKSTIKGAAICIAEVTPDNLNVFFEVGYALACEKTTFILWDQSKRPAEELPFDIRGHAGIPYDSSKAGWRKELRAKLVENISFELTKSPEPTQSSETTIAEILNIYLSYCEKKSSPRTYEGYSNYIRNFLNHIGKDADERASGLKPIQVEEWLYSQKGWGDNYIRGAITTLQVAYNWAVERGHITKNPIQNIEKPRVAQRDNRMPLPDYEKIRSLVTEGDVFHDVLTFSWNTDCRPEEIRYLEAKYIDLKNKLIRLPQGSARAGQKPRVIHLNDEALKILTKLVDKYPTGKLFRNNRKQPWSKYALCSRIHKCSIKAIGKPYALSDCRNGVLSTL